MLIQLHRRRHGRYQAAQRYRWLGSLGLARDRPSKGPAYLGRIRGASSTPPVVSDGDVKLVARLLLIGRAQQVESPTALPREYLLGATLGATAKTILELSAQLKGFNGVFGRGYPTIIPTPGLARRFSCALFWF